MKDKGDLDDWDDLKKTWGLGDLGTGRQRDQ